MREYGVEKCVCGNVTCIVDRGRALGWFMPTNDGRWDPGVGPFFCWKCGTRVGIDERGPWREAMVPRAALEWVADIAGGKFNDCPISGNGDFDDLPDNWCQMCVVRDPDGALHEDCRCDRKECRVEECWIAAALKAAEEGSE